jgi:hypothetical protein
MKIRFHVPLLHLLFIPLVCFGTLRTSPAQQPRKGEDLSANATAAFETLINVPTKGLDQCVPEIEKIIEDHKRLASSKNVSERQLSVVLANAVAFTLLYEIHRAEFARSGTEHKLSTPSIPFDKTTVVRLWRANMPEFEPLIRQILKENDVLTTYVASHSSAEDVLSGEMINKMPRDNVRSRFRELQHQAELPLFVRKTPTPDEQLVYTLTIFQRFRDLTVIVDLYEKNGLPRDSAALRQTIEGMLSQYPERRVDDGMKISAFKIWSTFRHYYPETSTDNVVGPAEEFAGRMSIPLAQFMNDRNMLPEITRNALEKMNR